MRARGHFDESGLQELKLWWEQFVEAVKMEPEVYRMLNFLGISIVLLVLFYTVGKIFLFRKASEPIIYAIIPVADIWILHKLAWGTGKALFFSLIPGFGLLVLWLTMIILCARFNGGALAYILSIMCPPLGILILGITGKFSEAKTDATIQYMNPNMNPNAPNTSYDYNRRNTSNNADVNEYQTQYDEIWGDILKK